MMRHDTLRPTPARPDALGSWEPEGRICVESLGGEVPVVYEGVTHVVYWGNYQFGGEHDPDEGLYTAYTDTEVVHLNARHEDVAAYAHTTGVPIIHLRQDAERGYARQAQPNGHLEIARAGDNWDWVVGEEGDTES